MALLDERRNEFNGQWAREELWEGGNVFLACLSFPFLSHAHAQFPNPPPFPLTFLLSPASCWDKEISKLKRGLRVWESTRNKWLKVGSIYIVPDKFINPLAPETFLYRPFDDYSRRRNNKRDNGNSWMDLARTWTKELEMWHGSGNRGPSFHRTPVTKTNYSSNELRLRIESK